MSVLMELSRIFIREMSDMQIIELSEVDGARSFPIVIGLPEAFAIERRLKEIKIPRPQTHDLLASTIRELGGTLRRIEIHDLEKGVFFAKLVVERDGRVVEIDSRPSDAIALGVAESVPIYVAEHVLAQASAEAVDDGGGEGGGEAGFEAESEDDPPKW
ncbi:MAG: bifunctional nuclease family protein [Phycisphaerales bacterium]